MKGQRKKVGGRNTYFPPFANELFDGPPWWACTFAALLNGANVGFMGSKPATHAEIRALAKASGDVDLSGGSRSSHMIRAMRARYGKRLRIESLPPKRAQERLASGWALVAAVTYGDLPKKYRRWSPNFTKGHRITLVGWNGSNTMLLDPLAREDARYTGEPIAWKDFEPAWWSGEQLWIAEGHFRRGAVPEVVEKVPDGEWRIAAGSRLVARRADKPHVIVRKLILPQATSGQLDAIVEVKPEPGKPTGRYLRVSGGPLAGTLIPADSRGLTLRTGAGGTLTVAVKPGTAPAAKPAATSAPEATLGVSIPKDPAKAFVEGRRAEWQRLADELGPVVNLPPPP